MRYQGPASSSPGLASFPAVSCLRNTVDRTSEYRLAKSLRRDAGVFHHLRPFINFVGNEARKLVRRAGPRRDGEGIHFFLSLGPIDERHEQRVELVDDRPRGA